MPAELTSAEWGDRAARGRLPVDLDCGPAIRAKSWYLRADGVLSAAPGPDGSRQYLHLPRSLDLPKNANPPQLPAALSWDTAAFEQAIEMVGPFKLSLHAASTAPDVDWIVKLQMIDADGTACDLTQGWLRASHRALDSTRSKPYRPYHPHDRSQPLAPGEPTWFEIAIIPTAQRFKPGQRLRIIMTSQDEGLAMQGLSHVTVGLQAKNCIFSDSRLLVPIIGQKGRG